MRILCETLALLDHQQSAYTECCSIYCTSRSVTHITKHEKFPKQHKLNIKTQRTQARLIDRLVII